MESLLPFDDMPAPLPAHQRQSLTSREAAFHAIKFAETQRDKIAAWFRWRGPLGGTQKEASRYTEVERPSMCARIRELEKANVIHKTATRRAGCFVYRVTA